MCDIFLRHDPEGMVGRLNGRNVCHLIFFLFNDQNHERIKIFNVSTDLYPTLASMTNDIAWCPSLGIQLKTNEILPCLNRPAPVRDLNWQLHVYPSPLIPIPTHA